MYEISVVIPIYNVEKYLEETILSVINQTIGFKEHIQMILVNDGSPDNSEEICLKYQEKYPDNILYIKKENGGVSSARNEAIPYIQGKYVNFLDSDDKWEPDAFALIYDFFEKNYQKVDVVAGRIHNFEANERYHVLDYKFEETRIAYLRTRYDFIQLHVTSTIIKREAIGAHRFSTELKYGEDAAFLNEILIDKCAYGIVREAEYMYRKRWNQSSAIQNQLNSQSYYVDSPRYFWSALFEACRKKHGTILDFIQYTVMYDIGWRIKKDARENLNEEQFQEYKNTICDILQDIEDRMIVNQKTLGIGFKVYALSLKYRRDVRKELIYDTDSLLFHNIPLLDFSQEKRLISIEILEVRSKKLHLEGRINTWLPDEDYEVRAEVGKKRYKVQPFYISHYDSECLDGLCYRGKGFSLNIPLPEEECELTFSFWYRQIYRKKVRFGAGKFSHLNSEDTSYYCSRNYLVTKDKKRMIIKRTNRKERLAYETAYQKTLKELELPESLAEEIDLKELVTYRKWYFFLRGMKQKEIWLISDRFEQADDNGEHLFRYLMNHKPKGVNVYFVLEKSSPDYERMKKYGPVVEYNSFWYKLLFLLSDKIISSQANDSCITSFSKGNLYMRDLYHFKFVCLQHGIAKNDYSKWLYRLNKNIKLLVTSAKPERESFLQCNYGYTEDVIQLTGLPRYDNLMRLGKNTKESKKIVIIPTWRKSLRLLTDGDKSLYSEEFKNSEFFEFYDRLIQDERILSSMREKGYEGLLCLHPLMQEQWVDFHGNEVFKVNQGKVNYQKVLPESSLLVTDYSSVAFDFSYLKRPMIYAQFDREEFFSTHNYEKGYFDDERDGFGPVCMNYEETVSAILAMLENNCRLEPEYARRIEAFYEYFDEDNCKRVVEAIQKL